MRDDEEPVTCLVVDDDHDGGNAVGEFLRALGGNVRVAYSGQAAIDVAPHFEPRLVVLDLSMRAIDGFQTCRQLRGQRWSRDAVFVAYTGMPASKAHVLAAGFNHLVAKGDPPGVLEKIFAIVASAKGMHSRT